MSFFATHTLDLPSLLTESSQRVFGTLTSYVTLIRDFLENESRPYRLGVGEAYITCPMSPSAANPGPHLAQEQINSTWIVSSD